MQLAQRLETDIKSGKYKSHHRLPTVLQLAEEYQVSRITVRQALDHLEKQHLIIKKQGKGTFVSEPEMDYDLSHLEGILNGSVKWKTQHEGDILQFEPVKTEKRIQDLLGIGDQNAVCLKRIYRSEGKAFALLITYLPPAAETVSLKKAKEHSTVSILEDLIGVGISKAEATIKLVPAGRVIGKTLKVSSSRKLINFKRLYISELGTKVAYTEFFLLPDRFQFELNVQGPLPIEPVDLKRNRVSTPKKKKFPTKSIEVVIHSGMGGGMDIFAHMVLVHARKELNEDMYVVSKKGGVTNVALNYVNSRPRDGHTIFALAPGYPLTILRGESSVGIDDIVPIARGMDEPNSLIVRFDSPFSTIQDLIDLGGKKSLRFGGTHIGGLDHIACFLFTKRVGLKRPVYFPDESGAQTIMKLMEGDVDVAVAGLSEYVDLFKEKRIRPLVIMSKHRLDPLSDVPTTLELGIDAESYIPRGFGILRGVPEERIAVLERAFLAAMHNSVYLNYLEGLGLGSDSIAGREEWTAQIRKNYEEEEEMLKDLGLLKRQQTMS
jgi:tripartite-type tricarboxylate transporter receptor subunit TctC/DNA-binding GntR family transcriptional regulator